MSKAEERAKERYWLKPNNIETQEKYAAYVEGYKQAEKDLELSWEDVKEICDISFEEACRFQRNMKSSRIYKEQHYQEVLKRFKNLKK